MPDPVMPQGQDPVSPQTPDAGVEGPIPPNVLDHLRGQIASAQGQKEQLDLHQTLNDRQVEDLRKNFMLQIFAKLKQLGVDASNPDSIKQFLDQLNQMDPDMGKLFEFAFGILSPDSVAQPTPLPSMDNQGLDLSGAPEAGSTPETPAPSSSPTPPPAAG